MRTFGLGVALLGCIATVAQADTFHTHLHATDAFVLFDYTSGANDCIHTSGVLFGVSSQDGTFALAFANRENTCDASVQQVTYGGITELPFKTNGLASASLSGTVEAIPVVNGPEAPLTFEFSLAFTGTGTVIVENNHFTSHGGGATISLQATRRRNANVTGSLTIDGAAIPVASAWLYGETTGDLSVNH